MKTLQIGANNPNRTIRKERKFVAKSTEDTSWDKIELEVTPSGILFVREDGEFVGLQTIQELVKTTKSLKEERD